MRLGLLASSQPRHGQENFKTCFFHVLSKDGVREAWLRIDNRPDRNYYVGQAEHMGPDEKGDITYSLRSPLLFRQEFNIHAFFPLDMKTQMIGPMVPIQALQMVRLVHATLRGHKDLRDEIISGNHYVFDELLPGFTRSKSPVIKVEQGNVIRPVFGR